MRWIGFLLLPSLLFGRCWQTADLCQDATFGPEIYHLERTRVSGTQEGWLFGFRGTYDRIRSNGFYFGGEGYYGHGSLKGHSRRGAQLSSRISISELEGRLGWTFQMCCWRSRPSFTPIVGIGYVSSTNRFEVPTPLVVTMRDTFNYMMVGFLSKVCFGNWSAGINFKTCFMCDASSSIYGDPFFPYVSLQAENKFQYVVEVPLTFHIWQMGSWWELNIVPFWRYRHLGGRENFPVDFFDTIYTMWGARLTLGVRF